MGNDPRAALAVTWETHPWSVSPDDVGPLSRRARARAAGPYRAAVPARIAELEVSLPPELSAEAEDALAEILRFDAETTRALPGLTGDLAPLDAVLLRTESASSSQIEHITAGARALALATLGERTRPNAALVAANVAAMRAAVGLAEDLDEPALLRAHAALMVGQDAAGPGTYRRAQVWIGGSAPTPHTAQFVPPHQSRVLAAMADLFTYLRRTDVPVLVQAAIAHAQFETIHPFADGNGRTGRVLVHAVLRRARATTGMSTPLSAGLLTDTAAYFDALTAYREGDPEPIVRRFAQAALAGVGNGRRLVADLEAAVQGWTERLGALRVRRDAAAWRALGVIVGQPAVTVEHVATALGVSRPAAQRAVEQLVTIGALQLLNAQRRNRVWLATEVLACLDEFAARAGRWD
ncbi:Fic family protein [Micrococcus sp.]|uniref:Fic family protein n=1 Tax=Micrococcus sp. TaxID=1271 RepID=UPI002A913C3C|nr:Fic family protein [Micrococcus sp.]MDY6054523.1 Fic family protein [Micrococcus sp.]